MPESSLGGVPTFCLCGLHDSLTYEYLKKSCKTSLFHFYLIIINIMLLFIRTSQAEPSPNRNNTITPGPRPECSPHARPVPPPSYGIPCSLLGVTRQTVLCTTPFSFGMKKLGKSILWHTVCINKKAGACSRLFVYAVFIRSAAILAYSGESSMPTHLLPVAFAARAVEPPPRKGSSTVPPSGTTPMSSAMS